MRKIQMGMMSSINACFIILVLSSVGAIAKTKVFNYSAGLDEDAYYYNGPIDFYYFVQRWPASYCYFDDYTQKCCYLETGNGVSGFSIHGLWPTYYRGRWPQYCCPEVTGRNLHDCRHRQFNPKKIKSLEDNLKRYWASIRYNRSPGCSSFENLRFWKYEWNKHGTCSTLSVRSYFEKTLSLGTRIDLLGALEAAGIHPDGREHDLNDIQRAIRRHLRVRPKIQCNINRKENSQLFEVYVCVKLDASTFMDCPTYPGSNCDPMVVFPRFGRRNE